MISSLEGLADLYTRTKWLLAQFLNTPLPTALLSAPTTSPAFWQVPHWILEWRRKTLEHHIAQVAKRLPRNLINDRKTKRYQKALNPETGDIVGYARWILPLTHAITEDAEIRRIADTAIWDLNTDSDELLVPIREIKNEILARKPYMRQEYADTRAVDGGYEEVQDRIVHVETLIGQLFQQRGIRELQSHIPKLSRGTSASDGSGISQGSSPRIPPTLRLPSVMSRCHFLSTYLHSCLPNPGIAAMMLMRGKFFSSPFQMLRQPWKTLTSSVANTDQLAQVSSLPPPNAPPVLFAQKLIQLALCLYQLDTTQSEDPQLCLNEPARDVASRYIGLAHHVTSQDMLVNSLDGLETLMLDSSCHVNAGDLRLAWLVIRRALGIAQLMGFPQLAENAGHRAEFLWFRLIYADRFLSLMLGLPFTVADNSFAKEHLLTVELPCARLERIQVMIVGRIIARNVRMKADPQYDRSGDNRYSDYNETHDINNELKQVARSVPVDWWRLPSLYNMTDTVVMEEFSRLLTQMHHYYLLVLLHQPYLIQRSRLEPMTKEAGSIGHSVDYTYSQLAILSASREMLSRVLIFRMSQHVPSTYRGLVDKAVTASTSLLLAHLDGHRVGRANVLEHQRPQDLGIITDVIDYMEEISSLSRDAQISSSIQVLRKLVEIEADAAVGATYLVLIEGNGAGEEVFNTRKEEHSVEWSIPYFGTVQIVRHEPKEHRLTGLDPNSIQMADLVTGQSNSSEYSYLNNMNTDNSHNDNLSLADGITGPMQPIFLANMVDTLEDNFELQSFMYNNLQDFS
ncbi:hypothetical protein B7463_g7844, partial [Scytalidium lignicola]